MNTVLVIVMAVIFVAAAVYVSRLEGGNKNKTDTTDKKDKKTEEKKDK